MARATLNRKGILDERSTISFAESAVNCEPDPDDFATATNGAARAKKLQEMNEQYSVVKDGGKVRVMTFDRDSQKVGRGNYVRLVPSFMSFSDFQNLTMNQSVIVNNAGKERALGEWWLKHKNRKQYDGLIFRPGGDKVVDGKLNLWRGWGVEPKAGDWSLMREHIRTVMTSNNDPMFGYVMNWLAWTVQHPHQRAEVALVFRGGKGVGKGTLGNCMMQIFGQHAVHISHAKYLTGFNAHLRDASFLFADEAYWPGDKAAEGNLKRLITEPSLLIEGKGRDAVTVENMLHVLMASNEDWIVPASERERRYVLNEVSDIHLQNEAWFSPIYSQMENGGYAAMLFDLLKMDLGDWHPRRIPANSGLADQQVRSLSDLDAWWFELLESATLAGCDPKHPDCARCGDYDETMDPNTNYPRVVRRPGLYSQARSIVPHLRNHTNNSALATYLKKQGCVVREKRRVLRKSGWEFPPLLDCRKAWEKRFPGVQWRDPSLTDWRAEDQDDDLRMPEEMVRDAKRDLEKANTDLIRAHAAKLIAGGRPQF
jgi:Family of unknown function (DUF5906)